MKNAGEEEEEEEGERRVARVVGRPSLCIYLFITVIYSFFELLTDCDSVNRVTWNPLRQLPKEERT